MKITHNDYKLPCIHATEWQKVLSSGSTEPMLILGIDQDSGYRDSYVLKPCSSPRMSAIAICNEYLGAWIGEELGLKVFEPVLINVSPEFAETLRGHKYYSLLVKSIGINFGTRFVPGCSLLPSGQVLTNGQEIQASNIMSFDMYIDNADRGAGNDNLLMHDSELFVFDHELAFSFIMALSFNKNPRPWEFREEELILLRKHVLYSRLKGKKIDVSDFIQRMDVLGDAFWSKAKNLLPQQWFSDSFDSIKTHLTLISKNRDIFANELSTALLV